MKDYIITLILTLTAGIIFTAYATNDIKKNKELGMPTVDTILVYETEMPEIGVPEGEIAYKKTTVPTLTPTIIPAEQRTSRVEPLASRGVTISLPLPKSSDGSFKAFERVSSITRQSSKQWKLQQIATTDDEGFRKVGEYYCIAIGQFYSKTIGETFIIKLESRTIKVIISDVKADKDTVDRMYCRTNGSIIEFVVDETIMTHSKLQELMAGKVLSVTKEN